jgi:hypothetical protein
MQRRDFIRTVAVGSVGVILPLSAFGAVLAHGNAISLRCLGDRRGPRYLDGRTHDGTVGLAADTTRRYSGTQWQVYGSGDAIYLKCLGHIEGPRWLDGRTHNGTVGLAPGTKRPYTGTRWKVLPFEGGSNIVALQCLGHIEGPRFLDGRTHDGTVWLASTTNPPFSGTKWEARMYPLTQREPELVPVDE